MKTPHQCLSHTCHGHHTEANLLQLVQHQARRVIHMILGTETSINKAILLSTDVGISASLSKLLLENRVLLIVLVLVHFLPHLVSFESDCQWQHLPDLYSITLNGLLQICKAAAFLPPPQPHWSLFFYTTRFQLCCQHVHVNCQNVQSISFKCLNMDMLPTVSKFTVDLEIKSARLCAAKDQNGGNG